MKLLFIASLITCVSEFCLPTAGMSWSIKLTDFAHIYTVEERKVFVCNGREEVRPDPPGNTIGEHNKLRRSESYIYSAKLKTK